MKNFSLKTKESLLLNSKERERKTYLIWIVVSFLVLFLLKNVVATVASSITSPLYSIRYYIETSSAALPVFIRTRAELLSRIHELEQEVSSQQGVDATLEYVMEENNSLRELLKTSNSPRIVAGVIARPPYTPYDTIIIDRGESDNIVEHAPVYHGEGTAIGYVRAVFKESALVTLFSSPGVESTVYLFGSNIFTTAYGEGGGIVRLSVPQGIIIERGDMVILPSLDTGVLGTIDEVQSIPSEPEQHAYVTLSVPLQSMRLVSVGARSIEPTTFEDALTRVREEEQKLLFIDIPESAQVDGELQATSSATTTVSEDTTL